MINSDYDVTICFITTQLKWHSEYDVKVRPSKINGLKKDSLIRLNKLATVDKDLIIGILGQLDNGYLIELNKKLIKLLQLGD